MATRRLGRGLSALIPDLNEKDSARKDSLTEIDVASISPNPFQPRIDFDRQALDELKASIAENGVITPVTVRPFDNGYQLIAGERRLRAVQELAYKTIPVYVLPITSDEQMLELSLVENIQREGLNPVEEAQGYKRLMKECGLTQEQVAAKVGKERATVANFLRLLKLPEPIQESLKQKEISAGHARALLAYRTKDEQLKIWKKVVRQGLSVRQVEQLARKKDGPAAKKAGGAADPVQPEVRESEDKLRQIFATQVRIHLHKKGGRIELEFYSLNDLERLLEMMLQLR